MILATSYTTVSVSNMETALSYYRDIIGMETKSDAKLEGEDVDTLYGLRGVKARRVVMSLQAGSNLHLVQHFAHKGRPVAATLNQYDIGFIHLDFNCKGIQAIYDDFQKKGVKTNCPIEIREIRKFRSFSFKAPNGVQLETHEWWVKHSEHGGHGTWLPEVDIAKGFYAFGHTALSIGDLDRTVHFYRDLLGMKITGQSFLQGEHFDNMDCLEGGRADNVLVRPVEGSEIQFIHHLAHKGRGRPIASTLQQCDYAIVNIGLETDEIEGLHRLLTKEGVTVNCSIQVRPDRSRAFSFRDPDGNLLIAESQSGEG